MIREEAGQWYVSFCYERKSDIILRELGELAYELNRLENTELSAAELSAVALGIDRNVRDNCIATSDGRQYRLDAVVLERIKRREIGAKRHQRRMARSQKGSSNRRKLAARLARKKAYAARERRRR
ncbi:transposase (fragment) [Paraburkholderia piptadeniae]|uniref:Transposase n=1 Tax=Paraburkholderia piptadeniae TaxID=1701573 RepID=A0A1N7SRK6_9BURK